MTQCTAFTFELILNLTLSNCSKMAGLVMKKLEEWQQKSKQVRILITGKAGTGKSSVINALTGLRFAEEGDTLQPKTTEVTEYPHKRIGDIQLRVWDSPGLQDGTTNEKAYLEDITRKCKDVDLIIYCIRMSQTRLVHNGPDSIAMQKLSQPCALGSNMWHNTIIVLTFANVAYKKGKYEEDTSPKGLQKFYKEEFEASKLAVKERLIHDVGLSASLVETIPIVPAGYHTGPQLPNLTTSDGKMVFWLSDLWLKALSVTKLDAQPAMIKLNENRMIADDQQYAGEHGSAARTELVDQMPLMFTKKGAEIAASELSGYRPLRVLLGAVTGFGFGQFMSLGLLSSLATRNKIITEEEYETLNSEDSKQTVQ